MNWDDLRILESIRDEGTYARAAQRLRIDETTVARRLARLESSLGVTLFHPVDGMRKPTAECETIVDHIRAMGRHATEIGLVGKRIAGPVGRFRIAATNTIAETVLAPRAGPFLLQHAGLTLQFLTSGENVNFSRWEADLAVRLRKPEKGDFSISKLADVQLFLFEPSETSGQIEPVVCCYPDELDPTPESRFLESRGLKTAARCITDNVRVIRALVTARAAIGILPDYLCADLLDNPQLRASPLPRRREIWLLVQNHLKRDQAARTVIDWIRGCFTDRAMS